MTDKPRGLIFDGALIPGVMAGTVKVTSRLIKRANPKHGEPAGAIHPARESGWIAWWPGNGAGLADFTKRTYEHGFPCPFRVGERRYLKEAWNIDLGSCGDKDAIGYKVDGAVAFWDGEQLEPAAEPEINWNLVSGGLAETGWRSPMLMPRWAARTWIEFTAVRPARCQEITREEILASGIVMDPSGAWCQGSDTRCYETSRDAYAALWERLNKARGYPWSANLWEWRCAFRTVTPCR